MKTAVYYPRMKTNFFCIVFTLFAVLALKTSILSAQIGVRTPSTNTTTSTTLTISIPIGLAVNDVMIVNIMQSNNDGNQLSDATGSDWTEIAGTQIYDYSWGQWRATLLYKIADFDDVAASNFTFTLDSDADDGEGGIVAYYGVDVTGGVDHDGNPGGPFDVNPGNSYGGTGSNSTTVNAPSITTVTANSALSMFVGLQNDRTFNDDSWSTTNPGSLTELYDVPFDATRDMGIGAAWAIKSAAGATGGGTATLNSSTRSGSILIALKEYSSSPDPCDYDDNSINIGASNFIPCIHIPTYQQTVTNDLDAGEYFTLNVISGIEYEIYTCETSAPSDPLMITVYEEGEPTEPNIAFSSSNTGNPCTSTNNNVYVAFTPTFSGQVRVLINQEGDCGASSPTGLTVGVNVPGGSNDLDSKINTLTWHKSCRRSRKIGIIGGC